VSKFELPETQFERIVRDKIACRLTWSQKMTVLSTYNMFVNTQVSFKQKLLQTNVIVL